MSSRFDSARVHIRRFQLVVGIGFLSCVVGALLSLAIGNRLREFIPNLHPVALAQFAAMVIRQLWEYAVLPVGCYVLARAVPLSPRSTAVGAVLTGELFLAVLDFFTGMSTVWFHSALLGGLRLFFMALGMVVTAWAIQRARATAERHEQGARLKAEQKKSQYDEFVKEAERIASLRETVSAEADAPTAPPPGTGTGEG